MSVIDHNAILSLNLRKVVQKSAENKMDLENLSTCFAVNLIDSKGAVDLKEAEVLTNNAKLFLMRMIADYNDWHRVLMWIKKVELEKKTSTLIKRQFDKTPIW